jgi:hypothetical protein
MDFEGLLMDMLIWQASSTNSDSRFPIALNIPETWRIFLTHSKISN